MALSSTEAEYVVVSSCCAQVLLMKHQLEDYGLKLHNIPIKCDNTSAIALTKNLVFYARTKHIEVKNHFIRDHVQKRDIDLEFIDTNHQIDDIFTKPLDKEKFEYFRNELGMIISLHVCTIFIFEMW